MNTISLRNLEVQELPASTPVVPTSRSVVKANPSSKISKQAIRTSLEASTIEGVFATIFSNITGGVLLTNFLLQLGASPMEIGLLSSIPMLANFLQPIGAYLADRMKSRHWYTLALFGPSRFLWLVLVAGIAWFSCSNTEPHQLVILTLGIILITNVLGTLGGCAWFSWMAALVPPNLRGRYFGFRNSAVSLTSLLCMPIVGFAISAWSGSKIQAYGVVLLVGIAFGIISLGCQFWITDVNPQEWNSFASLPQKQEKADSQPQKIEDTSVRGEPSLKKVSGNILKDINFLKFLLYIGFSTFAMNISAPYFNLYMLDNLGLDLSTVTLYTSLLAGANLVMLLNWGKLADRIGNRPVLLLVGILVAATPLFWLNASTNTISIWLWLPLIHLMLGGFGAAMDLCNSNIQMEIAPLNRPSQYFAIAAAVNGVGGGLGSMIGGYLAGLNIIGGLPGLFAISAVLRLIALLPLIFVHEPRSQSVIEIIKNFTGFKLKPELIPVMKIVSEVD